MGIGMVPLSWGLVVKDKPTELSCIYRKKVDLDLLIMSLQLMMGEVGIV